MEGVLPLEPMAGSPESCRRLKMDSTFRAAV